MPCKGPARATKGLKGALQRPRKGPKGALTGASNGLKKNPGEGRDGEGGMGRGGEGGKGRVGVASLAEKEWGADK